MPVHLAFPLIGAGSGGFDEERALEVMRHVLDAEAGALAVRGVRCRPALPARPSKRARRITYAPEARPRREGDIF